MDKGPSQSSSPVSPSSSSPSPQPQSQRPQPQQQHPQPPYGFQQQPQGTWTPSPAAAPFYPGAFYHQQPQGTPPGYPPTNPYFDPANAQLAAQWAYQQMMFNAAAAQQAQAEYFQPPQMHSAFNPFPSGTPPPRPNDQQFGTAGAAYHPYRRPSRQQSSQSDSAPPAPNPNEWRPQPPYSRPEASGSSSSVNSQGRVRTNSNNSNKATSPSTTTRGSPTSSSSSSSPPAPPRIPHQRAGSSSSTHSAHSTSSSSPPPSVSAAKLARPSPLSQGAITATPSRSSTSSSLGPSSSTRAERRISRDDSSLALSSLSLLATRAEAAKSSSPQSTATATPPAPTAVKGSGLKGRLRRALSFNSSVALKEELDDDYDEEEEGGGGNASDDSSIKASVVNPKGPGTIAKTPTLIKNATGKVSAAQPFPPPPASTSTSVASSSTLPPGTQVPLPKKKSRAASLFSNARLNASTDNISLSSTVSSASVMIRKLGSMGRLARRNSLAGITGLFKDRKKKNEDGEEEGAGEEAGKKDKEKDKDKDKDKDKKKKDKKSGKGSASEASVSHATAELEAGDWSVPTNDGALTGLSPAAKLARQHTLKSNAEAAAKAKEAAARAAAASAAAASSAAQPNGNGGGVLAWERNTATRRNGGGGVQVAEDGTRVFVEDSGSEDEGPQQYANNLQQQQQQWSIEEEDDQDEDEDEDWGMIPGEEDDTIRQEIASAAAGGGGRNDEGDDDEVEPWAVDVRRSIERTRIPTKGILKNASTYSQSAYLPESMYHHSGSGMGNGMLPALRARSNSYNSPGAGQTELGPLARIPSPDPDHIDGLQRHGSHSSGGHDGSSSTHSTLAAKRSSVPSLPPLAFDLSESMFDSPQVTPTASTYAAAAASSQPQPQPHPAPQAPASNSNSFYQHPALNSSAPALTTLNFGPSTSTSGAPRAATAPVKRHLAFASNLSVYDTFSPSTYDRRSEPATWSRLTPQLAQRIKEELNSYKMEEMEVHASSRVHTQFFV